MDELVSIIVPVYQVEQFLDECIASIVGQTYTNLEIILVDDGSPDKCPELCDHWAEKDYRIRVIHRKNGGLSAARNTGIDAARGDYLFFVDSDDYLNPDAISILLNEIREKQADICACGIYEKKDDALIAHRLPLLDGNPEIILQALFHNTAYRVSAWNKLYKRAIWEKVRFPEGKLCEDTFTACLVVCESRRIVQISEPLYYYRVRSNSIMTAVFKPSRMDEEAAWRFNCNFILEHYPQLYQSAFTFYLLKVKQLAMLVGSSCRKEYPKQYDYLRKIMKDHKFFLLRNRTISRKEIARYYLDCVKLRLKYD